MKVRSTNNSQGTVRAYYNEIDPDAAAILHQCIADGTLAPGEVDTRSIKDVQADDLRGFTQCHFFAGGGFWSVAARMAGWPDSRPLWTGSCPCQPFSAAGKGAGVDDPRHLWPDLFRLVRDASEAGYGPPILMGEQVSGAPGQHWFDGVSADLASINFASRSRDIPACSVDAPHQRNRLYWVAVANAEIERRRGDARELRSAQSGGIREVSGQGYRRLQSGPVDEAGAIAVVDAASIGRGEGRPEYELYGRRSAIAGADASGVTLGDAFRAGLERQPGHGNEIGRPEQDRSVAAPDGSRAAGELADRPSGIVVFGRPGEASGSESADDGEARALRRAESAYAAGRRNGSYWADAEWIVCHDGKARRAKPGLRLLVDGLPGRVDLWRVGGNAISPVLASEVIAAFLDAERTPAGRIALQGAAR